MNKVKESSLGDIKSVFNDNASNAHYYKIIHNAFNGIIKNLEFAKPIIQVNKGVIIWQSNYEEPYLSYSNLSEEKKQNIDVLIQDSLNEMAIILGNNKDKVFLDDIIEIPNEEAIFYTKDLNNNISVIITEWGYVKDEHIRRDGVLRKIFSTSMKSIILKFTSIKNELLEGVNALIYTNDFSQTNVSNAQGVVKLNNLEKTDTITVSSPNNIFEEVKFKVNLIEEYTIIVDRTFKLTFKVIDSANRPVKNQTFYFISDQFPSKKFQTDSNGFYDFHHPEKEGEFQVFSVENDKLLSESLMSRDEDYTIVYDPSVEKIREVIMDSKGVSVELEFLNWRRRPIANQKVDLYGDNGKTSYTTNKEGIVLVDILSKNAEYTTFMTYKSTDWKKEFVHKEETKHTFIVKMKRFFWWWLPFLVFFLLLLLIPTSVTHNYLVLNKNKEPIELASISSSEASIYKIQSYDSQTDTVGRLSLDYGKYPLYEQIFKKPFTDIFVSKSGYESLNAKVPLGYFKTRESIIYLDILPPQTYKIKEPIGDCNSGGDAHNAGGNSIKEFDLKQDSGEFVFTYNTGNRYADIIKIYDCPENEMNSKTPIWSIDEASGGDKSVNIRFTNRIITVEVIGGGNLESIWGYLVDCP